MIDGRLVVSVNEAAHALSISPWTIRAYITAGKLKSVRIGRRVLIEPSELERIVKSGREPRARRPVTTKERERNG
jgi:excisionase family DNA binding protein